MSGKPNIDYWKITLDNIRGTHIQGQLARPKQGDKFPALLIVQWAGVYPLQKSWVTDRAGEGWLVLNIDAHDLPIDEPADFYQSRIAARFATTRRSATTTARPAIFCGCFSPAIAPSNI